MKHLLNEYLANNEVLDSIFNHTDSDIITETIYVFWDCLHLIYSFYSNISFLTHIKPFYAHPLEKSTNRRMRIHHSLGSLCHHKKVLSTKMLH